MMGRPGRPARVGEVACTAPCWRALRCCRRPSRSRRESPVPSVPASRTSSATALLGPRRAGSRARPFRYPSDNAPAKPATDSAFSQDRRLRLGWMALSAADPAEELLQLDAVEAPDDLVVADPKHRNTIAVELLPFPHRPGIVVDRAEVEFDAKLVQKLDHRGRLDRVVGAVEDRFCVTHLCNQREARSITAIEPINCFDGLHRPT